MKNKVWVVVVVAMISALLGCLLSFGIVYAYPNLVVDIVTKTEKVVNVNEEGISSGVDAVISSVVVVENYQRNKLAGIGSGFVYDAEGYIMTNHHVVEDASEIKVILYSGETVSATVVGSDEYADIAVIKIDKKYVSTIAKLGNNEKMKLGDTVFTIGSPVDTDYAGTVTRGILSGKNRMVEVSVSGGSSDWIMNVMQTDAAINPGNSGGPLCNVSGEVIGINTLKLVEDEIEGLGFAIPIEDALTYARKIVNGEKIQRAFLGIQMTDISNSYSLYTSGIRLDDDITSGVIVIEPSSDGPSAKAGIKKGDVIVKIGSNEVSNVAELRYYLYRNYEPNDKVEIVINRDGKIQTIEVTLGVSE